MPIVDGTGFFMSVMMLAVMGVRVSVHRTVCMTMRMLMGRGGRHGNNALMAVAMFAVMVMGVCMRRAVGMGMRMLMFVVGMGMSGIAAPVPVVMAMGRAVFMHVPVSMAVLIGMNGLTFDARLADGTSTSCTHKPLLQCPAVLLSGRVPS
jgi:hypothetical protein